jgi:hypothetical protein
MRLLIKSLAFAVGSIAVFFGFAPAPTPPSEPARLVVGAQQCAPEKAQDDIVFISCGGFF